jgi:predicted Zn-dependent protease
VPTDRVAALEQMLERRPNDPRLRFGLALEYLNADRLEEGVRELRAYLESSDDEGNAWGRLGAALRALGRDSEAREAYARGHAAALGHGHPALAGELAGVLEDWDR